MYEERFRTYFQTSLQCEQIIQHLNHKIPGVNTAELCQVCLDTST